MQTAGLPADDVVWFTFIRNQTFLHRYMTTYIKAAPKDSAYTELMDMIGLSEARKIIRQVLNYSKQRNFLLKKKAERKESAKYHFFRFEAVTA